MVVRSLAQLKLPVTYLTDHLKRGTADEVIYPWLSSRGWFLVTHDQKMARKKVQREAMRQAGIGAFILVSTAAAEPREMTRIILTKWQDIENKAASTRPPFILRVPDRGKIRPF